MKSSPVDKWVVNPIQRFISNSTTSGIVLFIAALLAVIIANSPWSEAYHHFWHHQFSIGFEGLMLTKDLHHWINDGLMAIFFFVVGLELKREILAGELREPKKAAMPIIAAIGGMIVPALIYHFFNLDGPTAHGWGIPMATDIAFALGMLYLLGDRVPLSLKVFLTALAIVDDIGAVLVIAFFYTSDINLISLSIGAGFLLLLIGSNMIGVRSVIYYAIIGIGGLWLAFLMSGVHATIAAVLAAMTIPADVKVSDSAYIEKIKDLLHKFKQAAPSPSSTVTNDQLNILTEIRMYSKEALTPLQLLEHSLHPFVAFIVMPIFAFSNAGVTLSSDILHEMSSTVFLGTFLGLLVGKVIGVYGTMYVLQKLKIIQWPSDVNNMLMLGVGFLAAIGFTMSLFVSTLSFKEQIYIDEAKMGIIFASVTASFIGYFIIRFAASRSAKD
jgi:NhaA family Na+:H+ antiporter